MNIPTQEEAEARRDTGIARAAVGANKVEPGWTKRAAGALADYAQVTGKSFLVEDAAVWAHNHGLPQPPDARAWGAATSRAKRSGWIKPCGFGKAKTSNLSPKVLWEHA